MLGLAAIQPEVTQGIAAIILTAFQSLPLILGVDSPAEGLVGRTPLKKSRPCGNATSVEATRSALILF